MNEVRKRFFEFGDLSCKSMLTAMMIEQVLQRMERRAEQRKLEKEEVKQKNPTSY